MGGTTEGSLALENAGGADFVAVVLDIGTPAGVSVTTAPSVAEKGTNYTSHVSTTQPSEQMSPPPSTTRADINGLVSGPTSSPTADEQRPVLTDTTSPATNVDSATTSPTQAPTSMTTSDGGAPFNNSTLVAVLSSTLAFFVMVGVLWGYRRSCRKAKDASVARLRDRGDGSENHDWRASPFPAPDEPTQHSGQRRHVNDSCSPRAQQKESVTEDSSRTSLPTIPKTSATDERITAGASIHVNVPRGDVCGPTPDNSFPEEHPSSSAPVPKRYTDLPPVLEHDALYSIDELGLGHIVHSPSSDCRKTIRGFGVAQAVVGAARDLAQMSQIPGVTEATGLVIVLMNLVTDNSDIVGGAETMVKRCRSVVILLQRAARVLDYVSCAVLH